MKDAEASVADDVVRKVTERRAVPVAPGVHWIGALDPSLRRFDIILNAPHGTTYNSYAVRGVHGVAVIDTVKEACAGEFFARLESVAAYDEISAIVLNHLEPDHTGALPELMRRAPGAQLYISESAQLMLKGLIKETPQPFAFHAVEHGATLDLGGRSLRVLHTPYLHWPDTQRTFLVEERVLFSGDRFGCHYCDPRLFNDRSGDFRDAFDYYYLHIMRPFRDHVLRALDLIEPLELRLLAPAHGPVLREAPRSYIRRYREFASPPRWSVAGSAEKTLLIAYISAYGNTERMARALREGAAGVPGVQVSLHDLAQGEVAPLVDLIEEADGLAVGSPTVNGDAVKPVWDLLSSLTLVHLRGKLGAAFGSYGWGGEAVGLIEDRLRGLKLRVPQKGLRVKLVPTEKELDACRGFGRELARHLTGSIERRVIDMAELA